MMGYLVREKYLLFPKYVIVCSVQEHAVEGTDFVDFTA